MLDLTGVEDRGDHQEPRRLPAAQPGQPTGAGNPPPARTAALYPRSVTSTTATSSTATSTAATSGPAATSDVRRLTGYAHGGGCACKIPPGELEDAVRGLVGQAGADVLVGLDSGDDAAVVRLRDDLAVISTADFFTPVVDDAYDWGRIAAANALSDVYAMGGTPVVAINLVGWPRGVLPMELMTEVLRGGVDVAGSIGCPVIGGHTIDDPEPKYGMAVTGVIDPNHLLRNDSAAAGVPLTLTKPLGLGLLNNRHKQTGEVFPEAIETMTRLNRDASAAAVAAGLRAATDVTGFGLPGHLHKMLRASGVGAVIDRGAVPVLDAARAALRDGFVPGGSRRNLDWVRPHLTIAVDVTEDDLVILADAQTSGGLLVVGELPGYPVIGHTVPGAGIEVR